MALHGMLARSLALASICAAATLGCTPDGGGADDGGLGGQGGSDGALDGGAPDGDTPDGDAPDGAISDGALPDGDPSDGGLPPGDLFGAATGTWTLTFDDGAFTGVEAIIGGAADGRSVVVRAERRPGQVSQGEPDGERQTACAIVADTVHLRLADVGDTLYGHAVTHYRCGPLQPGERWPAARDWPPERFDRDHTAAGGSVIAWRTEGEPGSYGALHGQWRIEGPGIGCIWRLNDAGVMAGTCDRIYPWGGARSLVQWAGVLADDLASGVIDAAYEFAGQRDPQPAPVDALPEGDPLGGASGEWRLWGHRDARRLDQGATLTLSAEGTAVTARMRWDDITDDEAGLVLHVSQTLDIDLDVEDGAPGGTAVYEAELVLDSELLQAQSESYTATRLDAAPAAIPLLGGEWLLVPDDPRATPIEINVRGDRLTVALPGLGDRSVFTGYLDPRLITGVQRIDDGLRYGRSWISGRRVGD